MILNKKLHLILLAIATGLLFMLAGCGDKAATGTSKTAGDAPAKAPAAMPTPSREIVIEASDQMKFNVLDFQVAPGETVKLTLKNVGTMPKFSMGHNLVVLQRGVSVEKFAEAAASSPTTEYVPASYSSKVIAHTKLLGGGETDSVVFTAPKIRSPYPFVCTFPGHLQAGMRGTMTVQ